MSSKKVFSYNIHVRGIKKRCRKVDRHSIELCENDSSITPDQLKRDAIVKLDSYMKSYGVKFSVVETRCTDSYENGFRSRKFVMFQDQTTYDFSIERGN